MAKLKNTLLLICSVILINIPFLPICSAAEGEHIENVVFKTNINTVTASVNVTAYNKKRILVLAAYKNGYLMRIAADSKLVNGTEALTASIDKTDTDDIFAAVIEGFGGKVLTNKAVYGADSTALEYIKVNGEAIDYSDETDEYWVKYLSEPVTVDVSVKDAATKAEVSDFEFPGNAVITVVSPSGAQRSIVLHLYKSENDLVRLTGIKYRVGSETFEIEDFSPNRKQYSVELPDNVMGVTLLPEAVSDYSCMILNSAVETLNGVSLGSMSSTGKNAYQYRHNARNNYIPIKNEKTSAYVTVTSGAKSAEYQIDFTSKQPRLTGFEYVGAKDDQHQPVFIGGSALNNDNGTVLSMDRRWAVGNISEALLGGSCFMLPAENREKNKGYWWHDNKSGEYFNFTADTKGTVFVLSGNSIVNQEYEGWQVGSGSAEPPGDKTWITVAKDWNDYSAKYFAAAVEYKDDYLRAVNPGIAENDNSGNSLAEYSREMNYYAYRTFEAGEKVSVYHTGMTDQDATKAIVVIVWDGIKEKEDIPEPEPETPTEIEDEDKVMSLIFDSKTDTGKNIWEDRSGYNNSVSLFTDENNKWTENGFMVTCGSAQSSVLPDAAVSAVNSNVFTLQFELAELNPVSGKNLSILSSENGDFEIYVNKTTVYFKWAGNTTGLSQPKVSAEQVAGHLNTIVVDKNETDETQRIRWYIDGELAANKGMKETGKTADKLRLSNPGSAYEGSAIFKSLTVYKKALEEITGGGGE